MSTILANWEERLTVACDPVKVSAHMESLGDRLKAIRLCRELTLRGFATELEEAAGYDLSHNSVGNRETGSAVDGEYLEAVCRTFDVNPVWLVLGEGPVSMSEARETAGYADAAYVARKVREALRHAVDDADPGNLQMDRVSSGSGEADGGPDSEESTGDGG